VSNEIKYDNEYKKGDKITFIFLDRLFVFKTSLPDRKYLFRGIDPLQ
jgi:hypothetical protein